MRKAIASLMPADCRKGDCKSPAHTGGFVTVNDIRANIIRLHYLDWGGSGPALLFLAGRGCNAHIFDDLAPCFTGFFHVLALDRRGHGESDYPESGYDIDTLTEDIFQFLDCLQFELEEARSRAPRLMLMMWASDPFIALLGRIPVRHGCGGAPLMLGSRFCWAPGVGCGVSGHSLLQ